jgi:hypothetical protein
LSEITGADAVRLPTLRTTAETDLDLLEVWLKSHAGSSAHTLRAYRRIATVFVKALGNAGCNIRGATIDHVLTAVEELRIKRDGSPASPATTNTGPVECLGLKIGANHGLPHLFR